MSEPQISNPGGTYAGVSDFTLWLDGYSNDLKYERDVQTWRASAAISAGDWVELVAPTTTTPLSIKTAVVADAFIGWGVIGVALEAASAAGKFIKIVAHGPAIAQVGNTSSPAFGDIAVAHGSTNGASGKVAAASWDATKVAGTAWGVYLGTTISAYGGTTFAPVFVKNF